MKPSKTVLLRQLKKMQLDVDKTPESLEKWKMFLDRIELTYSQYEDSIYLLKRSLELSSEEMMTELERNKAINLQLAQAGKMAALGTLASGIAHELNNPLAAIKGFADLLRVRGHNLSEEKKSDYLSRILKMSDRMAKIIKSMLKLSRQNENGKKGAVCVVEAINESFDLLKNKFKVENIDFKLEVCSETTIVEANLNQLFGVFQNLFANSRDAFKSVKNSEQKYIKVKIADVDQGQLKISFIDNAGGMPKEVRNKIFDPFFTTKEVGKGTGLGLALSKQIIENLGGQLSVKSEEGRWTEFSILLGKHKEVLEVNSIADVEIDEETFTSATLNQFSKKRKILIVDDEWEVLEYLEVVLSDYFQVMTLAESHLAVEKILENDFDLIITDVKMPKVDGFELAKLSRQNNYLGPIVFISGHIDLEHSVAMKDFMPSSVLSKPLPNSNELVDTILSLVEKSSLKQAV